MCLEWSRRDFGCQIQSIFHIQWFIYSLSHHLSMWREKVLWLHSTYLLGINCHFTSRSLFLINSLESSFGQFKKRFLNFWCLLQLNWLLMNQRQSILYYKLLLWLNFSAKTFKVIRILKFEIKWCKFIWFLSRKGLF